MPADFRASSSGTTGPLWLSAGDFVATFGSAALGNLGGTTNRVAAMLMDAAATEIVGASALVPPGWNTVNVKLHWSNAGAGAGDVYWRARAVSKADTEDTNAGGSDTNTTATAPVANVLKITTILTGIAVEGNELLAIHLTRIGGDVADTLANDAGILGVAIERAT